MHGLLCLELTIPDLSRRVIERPFNIIHIIGRADDRQVEPRRQAGQVIFLKKHHARPGEAAYLG